MRSLWKDAVLALLTGLVLPGLLLNLTAMVLPEQALADASGAGAAASHKAAGEGDALDASGPIPGNTQEEAAANSAEAAWQASAVQTPASQAPAPQTPAPQIPAAEAPLSQTPAPQTPAPQIPADQTPLSQSPVTQTPVTAAEEPVSVALPMRLRTGGSVTEGDTDAYLVGVVLAEMPADFEPEALKAQAVAARTYTQKAWQTGGKHGDSSVCTAPSCCQAYIAPEEYLRQGGTEEGLQRVRSAVESTSGQVLVYEGALIEATYFSSSGGSTEDAAAVWGTDFPYLRSVPSPGEEGALYASGTVTFTPQVFQSLIGRQLEGSPRSWFGTVTYTRGGGVDTMVICNEAYSGTWLRSRLKLRSTAFTVLPGEETILILTRGYGHRVGMSQYGADAMAVAGSTYREILSHYYPGATLAILGG